MYALTIRGMIERSSFRSAGLRLAFSFLAKSAMANIGMFVSCQVPVSVLIQACPLHILEESGRFDDRQQLRHELR
jgi:hypothetical protein